MKTIAVACKTLKNEIMHVVDDLNVNYPILWVESGLHNTPEKLNKALQESLDSIANVENVLLLFGSCGNSLYGLHSKVARIVFPKVSDCISLFLGGDRQKKEWDDQGTSYYLTKGYLENESNIWTEYSYCLKKYGERKAKIVMDTMLKNYKKLRVIETGAYKLDDILDTTKKIASTLELEHEVIKGTINILYRGFMGEWDKDFEIIEPGESISYSHLGML
jgi:hypothetical protein